MKVQEVCKVTAELKAKRDEQAHTCSPRSAHLLVPKQASQWTMCWGKRWRDTCLPAAPHLLWGGKFFPCAQTYMTQGFLILRFIITNIHWVFVTFSGTEPQNSWDFLSDEKVKVSYAHELTFRQNSGWGLVARRPSHVVPGLEHSVPPQSLGEGKGLEVGSTASGQCSISRKAP